MSAARVGDTVLIRCEVSNPSGGYHGVYINGVFVNLDRVVIDHVTQSFRIGDFVQHKNEKHLSGKIVALSPADITPVQAWVQCPGVSLQTIDLRVLTRLETK